MPFPAVGAMVLRRMATHAAQAQAMKPLAGVRVLDLSRILAGPYCTMLLGDYGADVIKVEVPHRGDDTRSWGPPFVPLKNHPAASTYYLSVNRNKRSITIDFKTPQGLALLKHLAQESDVFVENFIPGKLDELGLGYDELHALNPRLVYCSISGYGPTGPSSQRAGYDVMVSAVGGLMSITGPVDGPPVKVGIPITDISTGLYAHGAIMAALLARARTGLGQRVDCSLLESQVAMLSTIASAFLNGGVLPARLGTAHDSIVPYEMFTTRDGAVVVGALNDKQFGELCALLSLPALPKDPRFSSNPKRVAHRKDLIALLSAAFASEPTAAWLRRLEHSSLPYGPVNNLSQTFEDAQVKARDMVLKMPFPCDAGYVRTSGFPVKLSDTPCDLSHPPPLLGQHTHEILSTVLGYDEEKIKQLKSTGALG